MPAEPPPQWISDHCRALGDRVRDRRMHLNMTQPQLAELAGVSWSMVQRIEAGYASTKLLYLLPIARALGVDPGELLHGLG